MEHIEKHQRKGAEKKFEKFMHKYTYKTFIENYKVEKYD